MSVNERLFFLPVQTTMNAQRYHRRSQECPRGPGPPPIAMLPMIKMSQKTLLFIQFVLASLRTTEHAYNSN